MAILGQKHTRRTPDDGLLWLNLILYIYNLGLSELKAFSKEKWEMFIRQLLLVEWVSWSHKDNYPPHVKAPSGIEVLYCKYGNFWQMSTDVDRKCCDILHRLPGCHLFPKYFLDVDYLLQRERSDYRAEQFEFTNCIVCGRHRMLSMHRYVLCRYRKLGQGIRQVVPFCMMQAKI